MNWLRNIFHQHKWTIIKDGTFSVYNEYGKVVQTGRMYVLQCDKCGDIKQRKITIE